MTDAQPSLSRPDTADRAASPAAQAAPVRALFSVLIPTMRRLQTLAITIESVQWQQGDIGPLELIIADNDPAGSARPFIEQWRPPAGCTVRYVHVKVPGKVNALEAGLRQASHPLVCNLDDDVVLVPGALAAYARAAAAWPDVDAFGGPLLSICLDGVPKGCEVLGRHRLYLAWPQHDLGSADRPYRRGESPMGGNRVFRRQALDPDRLFDRRFTDRGLMSSGDDMWLGERWHDAGRPMVYVAQARTFHLVPRNAFRPAGLRRRYADFGRYQVLARRQTAPPAWREYRHLLRDLPADVWASLRHRLAGEAGASRYHWYEAMRQCGMVRQILSR